MEHSIFMDKSHVPTDVELRGALGEKYGWSFRIKDKRRAIVYLLPKDGEFLAAFVFGGRAFDVIKKSDVSVQIISDLESARVYAEGRGIRIPVPDSSSLEDIYRLIDIKLAF